MKKKNRILCSTLLAVGLVAVFAITALAAPIEGPDEVYEGDDVSVTFNSPEGGGMEGNVTASDNLQFKEISTNNMGSQISTENHVFSLFGDPVSYTYSVSASAGEQVCVTLSDAEQSDAEGNLTQLEDQSWTQTVQATGDPQPSSSAAPSPSSGQPTQNPSQGPSPSETLGPIPTIPPTGMPTQLPGTTDDGNITININNTNINNNTNSFVPVRYPAYAPRPVAQRTVYRSNDGMPKMGDESSAMNYWALLTIGALLGVVVLVAATQLYAHRKNGPVSVTILR